MTYFIVGYMYAGKSTVGRTVARRLGMEFVDLDREFEHRYKIEVARFFEKYDEPAFRRLEATLLREVTQTHENVVVATGGGTPCYGDNMDFMLGAGCVVWLDITPEAVVSRALVSHNPRPLLKGRDGDELLTFVRRQMAERRPYYARANVVLEALHPDFNLVPGWAESRVVEGK
ncbi:MAG: shikimate kinase [Bacteroidales bacterium]|nr:shikimate kinase [Bacteroidales bacterium]